MSGVLYNGSIPINNTFYVYVHAVYYVHIVENNKFFFIIFQ